MSTGRPPNPKQKLKAKLEAKAAHQAKIAEKANRKRDRLEAISDHLGGVGIWTRDEPRGRRPRFTRDTIASAAVRIADAEGLDALSMRRLASELGSGTMTLYHYVWTKDEVLSLVVDAVMDEVAFPEGTSLPASWRDAINVIAGRFRDALLRHPWMLDITEDTAFGPNGVRHFDQTLEALSSLTNDLPLKLDIAMLVDEYVFGYCLHSRTFAASEAPDRSRQFIAYVAGLLRTGSYPQLSNLADKLGLQIAWKQIQSQAGDLDRFDRNLDRLLDGIEHNLPKK